MTSRHVLLALATIGGSLGVLVATSLAAVTASPAILLPVAFLLFVLVCWSWFRRMTAATAARTGPDPELSRAVPVPGAGFDQRLERAQSTVRDAESYTRRRIRDRLESLARDVFRTYGRLDDAEATDLIDRGSWTSSDVAATVLRGELPPASLGTRLRRSIGRSNHYAACVATTVSELLRYAEREVGGNDGGSRRAGPRASAAGRHPDDAAAASTTAADPPSDSTTGRSTNHWGGVSALAFGLLGFGLLLRSPALLLTSAVGVGYTAYGQWERAPAADVAITHSLGESDPAPGDAVTVTVGVRNDGDRALSDLRVIDGVPTDLAVVDGSPRHATVLPPGESASFEYTVRAKRGVHSFAPTRVLVRPVSGTREVESTVENDVTLTARPPLTSRVAPAVRERVTRYVGRVGTGSRGAGLEFHSVRQYRRGDPAARIDWKQYARSQTLSTVSYREERAAAVVLVIDARDEAYVAPSPRGETACERSATGAATLASALLDAGNQVGLAAFGPRECWIPPASDRGARRRIQDALTRHAAFGYEPPAGTCFTSSWVEAFRRRVSDTAQVVLLSPLCDRGAATAARTLAAYGYAVTVISPDPTARDTVGQQIAVLERGVRIAALRQSDVRVVDWASDERLGVALEQLSDRGAT